MTKKISRLLLTFGSLMVTGGAWATQDATATIAFSATISADCSVGNDKNLAYSALTVIGANGTANTTDQVTSQAKAFKAICTKGTNNPQFRFVSKNAIAGSPGHYDSTHSAYYQPVAAAGFQLVGADATTFIPYSLYADTTETAVITHDALAPFIGFVANGISQELPLSTKIFSGDLVGKKAQNYTDTVTVHVEFIA